MPGFCGCFQLTDETSPAVMVLAAKETGIRPLLADLEFTRGKTNRGYQMRFGLFEVSRVDMETIAAAMGCAMLPAP